MTKPHDEIRRTLAAVFGPLAARYDVSAEPFAIKAREAHEATKRSLEPFRRAHEEQQRQARQFADHIVDSMSRDARDTFPILASAGWFPDLHMYVRDRRNLIEKLQQGQSTLVDRLLVNWYEERLGKISAEIVSIFPNRTKPIRSACWAHRRKRYYLSIPVFLAQSDGICAQILGASPFLRRNGRPKTASVVEKSDHMWPAVLAPLAMCLPISASEGERRELPSSTLNRHAIIHGEPDGYGTRTNSAKALSLLNYVALALKNWKPPPNTG